jgi:hypothetical protein
MRISMALALAVLCSFSLAAAGEIYGTITEGNKPVAQGLKVEVSIAGKTYAGEANKFGAYRIFVQEKGKCTLTVSVKGVAANAELFSYDKSTRYDWIVEVQDGKPLLRRK